MNILSKTVRLDAWLAVKIPRNRGAFLKDLKDRGICALKANGRSHHSNLRLAK
jgi:hypothetical protein